MKVESNTSGRKQFQLSDRLTIEVWTSDRGIEVEWAPSIPSELSKAEMEKYQDVMAELFERLSSDAVVMVDVGDSRASDVRASDSPRQIRWCFAARVAGAARRDCSLIPTLI